MLNIIPRNILFVLGCALVVGTLGCQRPRTMPFAKKAPVPPPEYVTVSPKEASELPENEYLMRKATIGSRAERLEALDVIDRSADADYIPFLLERLEKEDDRMLQIRVMKALAKTQDVRAVAPLRKLARWDETRVAVVAVESLYELGDDAFIPKLIQLMRQIEEFPELSGIAHRALKKIYEVDLPNNLRVWNSYYQSHRLAPYQQLKWYAQFRPPIPPTVEGTTKVEPTPRGRQKLPEEDVRVRRHLVTGHEFWKPDERDQ